MCGNTMHALRTALEVSRMLYTTEELSVCMIVCVWTPLSLNEQRKEN